MPCPHCNGTGFRSAPFTSGGQQYTGMKRCECREGADAGGGFEKPNYELPITNYEFKSLAEPDSKIAEIILQHRGKKSAVSIEEICKALWPQEWAYGGAGDAAAVHARRNNLIRSVKASVERIRKEAQVPIAATKAPPYGYYIPVTAEECDECYRRLFGEGVKLILLSRLFRPDADVVQELRGQLRIASSEL